MLRITAIPGNNGKTCLKLEGRLVEPWVELLRQTCQAHRGELDLPLTLDLSAVGFASREGLRLLHHLQREGVSCASWPPFLKELSRQES